MVYDHAQEISEPNLISSQYIYIHLRSNTDYKIMYSSPSYELNIFVNWASS